MDPEEIKALAAALHDQSKVSELAENVSGLTQAVKSVESTVTNIDLRNEKQHTEIFERLNAPCEKSGDIKELQSGVAALQLNGAEKRGILKGIGKTGMAAIAVIGLVCTIIGAIVGLLI